MGNVSFFNDSIDKKLLDLHCAYLAKVLSTDGTTAKIQPLGQYKEYGSAAKNQAVVSSVPVISSAQYKITSETITYKNENDENQTKTVAILTPIAAGNIVLCVCCDRDITEAKNGVNAVPVIRSHDLSDSVIVGVIR